MKLPSFLVAPSTAEPMARPAVEESDVDRRPTRHPGRSGLDRVLCAVDGSLAADRAIRQAIAISAPGGSLQFLGLLADAATSSAERRTTAAVEGATRSAVQSGRRATSRLLRVRRVSEGLLAAAVDFDIVVMAATDRSDEGGLGRAATIVAHRCPLPLLLARRSVGGASFPSRVLLASDGSPGSWYAAETCADLAVCHGGRFDLVRVVEDGPAVLPYQVRAQLRMLEMVGAVTGSCIERRGDPSGAICQTGINTKASLLVIGRGSTASRSRLGTVAESVAHRAGCSVLLAAAP